MSAENFEADRREELLDNFMITVAAAFWSCPERYSTIEEAAGGLIHAMDDRQLQEFLPHYVSEFVDDEDTPWKFDIGAVSVKDGVVTANIGTREELACFLVENQWAQSSLFDALADRLRDYMYEKGYDTDDVDSFFDTIDYEEKQRLGT